MLTLPRSKSFHKLQYSILQCKSSTSSKSLLLIGGRGQLGAEIEKTYRQSSWAVTVIGKEEMDQFLADRDSEKKFFSGTLAAVYVIFSPRRLRNSTIRCDCFCGWWLDWRQYQERQHLPNEQRHVRGERSQLSLCRSRRRQVFA